MIQITEIEQSNKEHFETAVSLLTQFFAEEGFSTPPKFIRENLKLFLESDEKAVFLANDKENPVAIATVAPP